MVWDFAFLGSWLIVTREDSESGDFLLSQTALIRRTQNPHLSLPWLQPLSFLCLPSPFLGSLLCVLLLLPLHFVGLFLLSFKML